MYASGLDDLACVYMDQEFCVLGCGLLTSCEAQKGEPSEGNRKQTFQGEKNPERRGGKTREQSIEIEFLIKLLLTLTLSNRESEKGE